MSDKLHEWMIDYDSAYDRFDLVSTSYFNAYVHCPFTNTWLTGVVCVANGNIQDMSDIRSIRANDVPNLIRIHSVHQYAFDAYNKKYNDKEIKQ